MVTNLNRREVLTNSAKGVIGLAAIAAGLTGIKASTLLAAPTEEMRKFPVPVEHDWFGPRFPLGSIAIVDRDLKPKDDDLVYARLRFPDHPKMNFEKLLPFWVKGGKDENGRFVRAGDPREIIACIAPMAIARKDFDNGVVEIVGTARYSVSLAQFRHGIESVMRS